jgi:mannose/fructose/N-acetylgalactosamine-specific phosphotransferase system component IIB
MKIAMVRVDERLIHGQVTMGYVRTTGANLVLAVNDAVAQDAMQKNLMKLAAPPGVDVEVLSLDDAWRKMEEDAWPRKNILLMIRNPVDLLRLIEKGFITEVVNIGGVRTPGASIKLTKEVSATEEELDAWKKLDEMGCKLEVQWVSGQKVTNLNDILKKY